MPRGWGDLDEAQVQVEHATIFACRMPPTPPASYAPFALRRSTPRRSLKQVISGIFNSEQALVTDAQQQQLLQLLSRQNADGSFNGNDAAELLDSCGLNGMATCTKLEAYASQANAAERSQLVQTLAVLVLLQHSYAALKDQWQRAEKKARRYVEHAVGAKLGAVMDLVAA